jgi:hypothetical protein
MSEPTNPTPETTEAAAVSALDLVDLLTLGELATAEELSGTSINALSSTTAPMVPLLIALACVVKRRSDPTFTLNQAEALTGKGLNDVFNSVVKPTGPVPEPLVVTQNPAGGGVDPEG